MLKEAARLALLSLHCASRLRETSTESTCHIRGESSCTGRLLVDGLEVGRVAVGAKGCEVDRGMQRGDRRLNGAPEQHLHAARHRHGTTAR